MLGYGKVVGGHFMNATITTNRKGELSLQPGGAAAFKKRPTLTADTVAAWEEIIPETRGGAAGVVSKVARAALPGVVGKAASAAIDSAKAGTHTVRVDCCERIATGCCKSGYSWAPTSTTSVSSSTNPMAAGYGPTR